MLSESCVFIIDVFRVDVFRVDVIRFDVFRFDGFTVDVCRSVEKKGGPDEGGLDVD